MSDGDPRPLPTAAIVVALLVAALAGAAAMAWLGPDPPPAPGVVLVLVDDQGWAGTSVPMDPDDVRAAHGRVHTPALERLAAEGMRFSFAYAPGPTCQPSRASIQTGRSPARLAMTTTREAGGRRPRRDERFLDAPDSNRPLPVDAPVIAAHLEATLGDVGTAHFGKWQLLGPLPEELGYDEGTRQALHDGATPTVSPDPKGIFTLTDKTLAFIAAQRAAGRPWFVQLSHHAIHKPLSARPETAALLGDQGAGLHAANTADLDAGLGRLLDGLDALGVADTTLVVYTSDNGSYPVTGALPNGPLKGGKNTLREGGIRVPLVVRGPGVAPGSHSDEVVSGTDLYATIAAFLGAPPAASAVDSLDLLPALRGGSVAERPQGLLFHLPHYASNGYGPHSALVHDHHKIVRHLETGGERVYALRDDPTERDDLAGRDPERLADLRRRLDAALAAHQAHVMAPNPAYEAR